MQKCITREKVSTVIVERSVSAWAAERASIIATRSLSELRVTRIDVTYFTFSLVPLGAGTVSNREQRTVSCLVISFVIRSGEAISDNLEPVSRGGRGGGGGNGEQKGEGNAVRWSC